MTDFGGDRFSKYELLPELDALADALDITWPAWYPELIRLLADSMSDPTEDLPGGFLMNSARMVYEDTMNYRGGHYWFYGIDDYSGRTYRPIYEDSRPFPHSFVVVGSASDDAIIIDCDSQWPFFMWNTQRSNSVDDFLDLRGTQIPVTRLAVLLIESQGSGYICIRSPGEEQDHNPADMRD
ncbi:MAG: hypothetical protein AAFY08_08410 [Planctomycetota bacterium]